jgi:hypothetical protein
MNLIIWSIGIYIFLYTMIFAVRVFRGGNKLGGAIITVVALLSMITPYFMLKFG